jgi:hypothetical protein
MESHVISKFHMHYTSEKGNFDTTLAWCLDALSQQGVIGEPRSSISPISGIYIYIMKLSVLQIVRIVHEEWIN